MIEPLSTKGEILEFKCKRCGVMLINFKDRENKKCMLYSKSLQAGKAFFYSRKQKSLSGFQNDFWSLNAKNNNLVSWMFIPWSCLFGCSWWRRKKNSFEVDMCKRCRTGSHKMWHEMGLGPRFVSLWKHRQRAQHIKVHWSWRLIIFKCCTCLFSIFSYC